MGKYKLVYFDLRGRGEAIRYLFLDNGIEFEDFLINPDESFRQEWKPKMQFGQVPCLYDDGFQLVQFNSILRHLGRKHNLYGEDLQEAATIDMLMDGIEDVRKKYTAMIYGNYENGKQPYIDALPKDLDYLEKMLLENDAAKSGYCVGKKPSLVDYNMFDILDIHLVLSPTCLEKFPTLAGFHKKILERPNITTHRQSEKFKTRTINYGPNQ